MTLTFRPAADTESDAAFFAWGLNEAMDGFLDSMFGRRSREILAAVSRIPGHDLSLEHVILAEADGQAVGMLSGMQTKAMADVTPALRRCAGMRVLRAGLLYLAGRPLFQSMSRHAPGEWYLQVLAVAPEARGAGVGSRLLDVALEQARKCGCDRITLDVVATNAGGIRLYERQGYEKEWTSPRAWLLGGARVHRLSKAV